MCTVTDYVWEMQFIPKAAIIHSGLCPIASFPDEMNQKSAQVLNMTKGGTAGHGECGGRLTILGHSTQMVHTNV